MQLTPSKVLFCSCIALMVGLAVEYVVRIPQLFLWGFLLLGVMAVAASFVKKEAALVGFCLLFFTLGILRLQTAEFAIAMDPVSRLNDSGQKITVTGQIVREPDVRNTSQKLTVQIDGTHSLVLVTVGRYPQYQYLDRIQLVGKLKTPSVSEDFNYQHYLQKDGIYSVMDYPAATLVSGGRHYNAVTFLYAHLLAFKQALQTSINTYFSPPGSLIIKGVILGGSTDFPADLQQKFSTTGLTHLTAISGSNVVILSTILMGFLVFLGLWRSQACYVSILFVWLYIAIAAFPASGVRAAIMATVFLISQHLGRQNTTSRVIVVTAAVMLLQNPLLLFYDVGFELSFLASLGIIYGKPLLDRLFSFTEQKLFSYLLSIISVTMAAQIFTFPVIAYYFKTISLVAPITNLLIIPTVDAIMISGFLAALFGIFSSVLGFLFSLPAWVLLLYFMKVLDIFSQPWAVKTVSHISWIWIAVYYIILASIIAYINRRYFRQNDNLPEA